MAVIVITGGTAGVGKATALHFAKAGYDVGIIARDEQSLRSTEEELRRFGINACAVQADVADSKAVTEAANEIEYRLGAIDVWVNNAMGGMLAPFRTMSPEEFRRVTEVTYLGYVNGTRAALELMTPRDRGTIIQVGSALAYRSIPLQSAYCGAKAAIRGFTDAVRTELMHENSRVQIAMVQMPGLNTPQFEWARNKFAWAMRPVPPVFQPEVAASAIFKVAQKPVRELWVGSSTVQSIVGQFLFPGFLDRLMVKKAWEGQMTDTLNADDRQDYLDQPVNDLHKIHGHFTDEAKERAISVTSGMPGKVLLGSLAVTGAIVARLLRFFSYPFQIQLIMIAQPVGEAAGVRRHNHLLHRVAQRSCALLCQADVKVLIEPEIQHQVEPVVLTKIIFVGLDLHVDFAEQDRVRVTLPDKTAQMLQDPQAAFFIPTSGLFCQVRCRIQAKARHPEL